MMASIDFTDEATGQSDMPDAHSATREYAARFAGPAGEYMLGVQTEALLDLMKPWTGAEVLDVGGGHAQAARPLADLGHKVTVLASDQDAWGQAAALAGRVQFRTGDLCHPPFPRDRFDVSVSFRMMPHVRDWRELVAGLCATARDAVIVDFPIPGGSNALEPLFFGLKKSLESNTRHFVTISKAEVRAEFERHGFEVDAMIGQFVLPMAVHRALRMPAVSVRLERALAALGLDRTIGTPVILRARRIAAAPERRCGS